MIDAVKLFRCQTWVLELSKAVPVNRMFYCIIEVGRCNRHEARRKEPFRQ